MVEQQSAALPDINPETLAAHIVHALRRAQPSDRSILVVVEGSKVTLFGVVQSQRELKMAEAVAWVTKGVTEVENDLVVD
ncbi:MAG TPA: BON domain-containing protein [Caulobacteraceae bacterium]|nr:BON domain-containing protein [Caulobacteraceae bacterium]